MKMSTAQPEQVARFFGNLIKVSVVGFLVVLGIAFVAAHFSGIVAVLVGGAGLLLASLGGTPFPSQPWSLLVIAFVILGVFAWQGRPAPPLFWFVVAGLLWWHTAK